MLKQLELDFLEKHKNSQLILDAFNFAKKSHKGQYRKGLDINGNKIPYFVHCIEVANLLEQIGIDDEISIATGLVHDTDEDNKQVDSLKIIENINFKVAKNVYFLSRNTLTLDNLRFYKDFLPNNPKITKSELIKNAKQIYKIRLLSIKNISTAHLVKLADNCNNTLDLHNLRKTSIEDKLNDAFQLYLPYSKIICPPLSQILEENINKFLINNSEFEKYRIDYGYVKKDKIEFIFEYISKLQDRMFII